MADEEGSSELDALERLKSELILDYCSYKLWNEFKRGSQMSKGSLRLLKDLYINKGNGKFEEELERKLYCTRFICGLSEARCLADDGNVKYTALHPMCLTHAEAVLKMYPFSASEQSHFKNTVRLQIILSTYRAGKFNRAKRLFLQLYLETGDDDEEYQDEIQEFFESENETFQQKVLLCYSYEKFLRSVCDFLDPFWEKYDIPLLEKFKGDISQVDDGRIPGFFLRACNDYSLPADEDCEESWQSIINESHPDIISSKKNQGKELDTMGGKTAKDRSSGRNRKNTADNDGTSTSDVDEEIKKSQEAIARLKTSSKRLNEFVKQRNERSGTDDDADNDDDDNDDDDNDDDNDDDDNDDDDNDDDENVITPSRKKEVISKKSPVRKTNQSKNLVRKSPIKRRWNEHQEDAETIEWSLSEDEDHPAVHLPSPRRRHLNVLLPRSVKYRKRNPWTEEELSWLCKGVQTYGEGKWSTILRMFAFKCRTSVDLKDKWRNHTKSQK